MTFIAPQAKLFGHLTKLGQLQDSGRTSAPISLEVDLSNRCSLGCRWCHMSFTHVRGPLAGKVAKPAGAIPGGDLMPVDLAKRMIDQAADAGVLSVTWTGGGEPTLHPHFNEIVEYADGKLKQSIYTHGGHIDDARAALLKRALTFVYVSLDAVDALSYKRDKGVDRFTAACDGIRRLVAAEGDATVGIGFLVTRQNWPDIWKAAQLVQHLDADYVQLRPTILYDQPTPDVAAENTAWIDEAMTLLEEVSFMPNVEVDLDRFRMYRDWQGHGYETCWWSMLQTCITPNGKMWACVNRREHPSAEIGDLSVESFAEVWARQTAQKVGADCRVMCRGQLSNLTLDSLIVDRPHPEFV